jgi:WD40 repeat protein
LTAPGHHLAVRFLAFSQDARRLLLTTGIYDSNKIGGLPTDPRLRVWEVATGNELLSVEDVLPEGGALSPDGRLVAAQVRDPELGTRPVVKVWDVATRKVLAAMEEGQGRVDSPTFSPDGARLAGAVFSGPGQGVVIWDTATGKIQQRINRATANGIAFNPDGTRLAVTADNGGGSVFDPATGQKLVTIQGVRSRRSTNVLGNQPLVFSHDGRSLAGCSIGLDSSIVRIFDAATGEVRRMLKGHTGVVCAVAFSPDDRRLYTSDHNGTVKIWDTTLDDRSTQPVEKAPTCTILSPDGSREARFTPVGPDNDAPSFDVIVRDASGKELHCFKGHTAGIRSARFSPDGRYVVSADQAGEKKVWEAATGKVLLNQKWPQLPPLRFPSPLILPRALDRDVQFSTDGARLAAWEPDGGVKVWDLADHKEVFACKDRMDHLELSPDSLRLVTVEGAGYSGAREQPPADQKLRLWDVGTGKEMVARQGTFSNLTFSPDGKRFAAIQHPEGTRSPILRHPLNQVKVWDAHTGAELATLTSEAIFGAQTGGHPGFGVLGFSPDGTRLASISSGRGTPGAVLIWDVAGGKELFRLKEADAQVTRVVFSPDGKRIATGTWSNAKGEEAVKLWDAATGSELLTLKVEIAGPKRPNAPRFTDFTLFFSSNGARLSLHGRVTPGDLDNFRRWGVILAKDGFQTWDATPLAEQR